VLIAAAIWAAKYFVDRSRGTTGGGERSRTPLEILEKRYARGEISDEEFAERKHVLEHR
jgi:uncharacterized membrane protein